MEFWFEIAFWMSISHKSFSLTSLTQQFQKHEGFIFFIIKEFSYLFNYLRNISIFAFYIALYDTRKVEFHTHGNLMIDHGITMEESWNFI